MQIQNLLESALRTGKKLLKSFLVMLDQFLTKTPKFFILTAEILYRNEKYISTVKYAF